MYESAGCVAGTAGDCQPPGGQFKHCLTKEISTFALKILSQNLCMSHQGSAMFALGVKNNCL